MVRRFLSDALPLREAEVMDVDEEAFRQGRVSAKLYGYVITPYEPILIQGSKVASLMTDEELRNQAALAIYFIEEMKREVIYVIGPGTTTRTIGDLLEEKKTLLGVDLFCNKKTLWGIRGVLRQSGGLKTTTDAFGRKFSEFEGALLVDVGLKADMTAEIITNTETAEDGGSDSTSIYAVNMEIGRGCHGIKLGNLDIYDPLVGGEKESGPQTLLRVDWGVGLANWSDFSIARLSNFGMVYA